LSHRPTSVPRRGFGVRLVAALTAAALTLALLWKLGLHPNWWQSFLVTWGHYLLALAVERTFSRLVRRWNPNG
jgi:hypothetical protein